MNSAFRLRHVMWLLPLLVGAALILSYAFLDWQNFYPDSAFGGLMARHWLAGEHPIFPWAQRYFGTSVVFVMSIPFMFFSDTSIVVLRSSFVVCTMLIALLTVHIAYRLWGRAVALATAYVLSVPSIFLLQFLTSHPYPHYGLVGMGCIMLVLFPKKAQGAWNVARWLCIGLFCGFGLWASPTFLEYIVAVALVALFCSPEWGAMWRAIRSKSSAYFVPTIIALALLAVFASLLAFGLKTGHRLVMPPGSVEIILSFSFALAIALFAFSSRKIHFFLLWIAAITGFLIGNAPQIIESRMAGDPIDFHFMYYFPAKADFAILAHSIIPAFWGLPPLIEFEKWLVTGPWKIVALTSYATGYLILVAWLWLERGTWKAMVRGERLSADQGGGLAVLLMIAIPFVSLAMRQPADVGAVRYMLEAWPFWTLLVGFTIRNIARHSRFLAISMLVFFLAGPLLFATDRIRRPYKATDGFFHPSHIAELEDYLRAHDITGAYASYGVAFPVMFLTDERLTIANYETEGRNPAFSAEVGSMRRFAFILQREVHLAGRAPINPADNGVPEVLMSVIITPVRARLRQARILDVRQMQFWDVWILEDPPISLQRRTE